MKKLLLTLCCFTAMTFISTTVIASTKMRVSHQLPPAHPVAKVIDRWASEIEKLSNDNIDVQIFGANSLIGARENAMAVASGNIECAFTVSVQWGKTIPVYSILARPFTIAGTDLVNTWPTSKPAEMLEKKLAEKNLTNLVWMLQTQKSIYTSSDDFLKSPDDFKGVKIRGTNPIMDAGVAAMGASPVPMSGSKVYQALSTGVIDAAETGPGAAYARKYFEVQEYGNIAAVSVVYWNGYANTKWYNKLSDTDKEALRTAGLKAAKWAVEAAEEVSVSSPDKLRKAGMKIHMQTPEEAAKWSAIMQPAFDKVFFDAAGGDGPKILELVKSHVGKN